MEAQSLAASRCEHAWRTQRKANDWKGFLANLREVVRLAREEAKLLADATGLSRYDAMMDRYEPGMTSAELDASLRRPEVAGCRGWSRRSGSGRRASR